MKRIFTLLKKVEYELPAFALLAVKLPVEQIKIYGPFYIGLCTAASLLLGSVIRRAGSRERIFVLIFAALLLAGDITKTLFMPAYTVPSDILLKAVSLLCFLSALAVLRRSDSGSHRSFFVWGVPLLCMAGTIAWPSFLFFYLPAVLILTVYEKEGKKNGSLIYAFHAAWFLPLAAAGAFVVPGFFTGKKLLGFIPFPYGFKILPLREIGLAIAAALPLIVIFILLWLLALRSAADKKTKRLPALCMAEPAAVMLLNLFTYYTVSDGWKYYIAAALFTQFCIMLYFVDAREKTVEAAFVKTTGFLLKNPFILLAILIYLMKASQLFYPV